MAGLETLPIEVLHGILGHLHPSDLQALCLGSWSLYAGAVKVLYREVVVTHKWEARGKVPSALFLRALLNRPQLPGLVESLTFLEDGEPDIENDFQPRRMGDQFNASDRRQAGEKSARCYPIFTSQELGLAQHRIGGLPIPPALKDIWQQELSNGRLDAFAGLSFLACIDLKALHLSSGYLQGELSKQAMRILACHRQPTSLLNISLSSDVVSTEDVYLHTVTYPFFLDLLRLPKIQSISVPLPAACLEWTSQVPSSSLQTLVLHHCQLYEESLGQILQATPRLRQLEFDSVIEYCAGPRPGRLPDECFDCERLEASLQHVQSSLEKLKLSVYYFHFGVDFKGRGVRGSTGSVSSLHRFKKLSSLEVPYVVLLGWTPSNDDPGSLERRLPPHLNKLTLTDDLLDMEDSGWSDEALLAELEIVVPKIARNQEPDPPANLKLQLQYAVSDWKPEKQDRLVTIYEAAGVVCHVWKKSDEIKQKGRSNSRLVDARRGGPSRLRAARSRGRG